MRRSSSSHQRNPAYLKAHDWLAKSYEASGELEEAQRALVRCTELSPNSVIRQKNLGKLAHKRGDPETAELLAQVNDLYSQAGMSDQGEELVRKSRQEVIAINDRGASWPRKASWMKRSGCLATRAPCFRITNGS